jgi:hypothetical protein
MRDTHPAVILVKSGWDPTARPEADEPRCGQKIFHQKNTCGVIPEIQVNSKI